MNALVVTDRASEWRRLKALVLDSVSSPITRRVYNLGLDEFIAWFTEEPRPAGFTKATVTAWRVALEARRLGPISINVRITEALWSAMGLVLALLSISGVFVCCHRLVYKKSSNPNLQTESVPISKF